MSASTWTQRATVLVANRLAQRAQSDAIAAAAGNWIDGALCAYYATLLQRLGKRAVRLYLRAQREAAARMVVS